MPYDGSDIDRARRLLTLVRHLPPGSSIPTAEMASSLGVSERCLTTDVETLSLCAADPRDPLTAIPIYIEDGLVHVTGSMPAFDRTIRLTAAEAQALLAALQACGRAPDDTLGTKLSAAATCADTDEIGRGLHAVISTGSEPVFTTLVGAIVDLRRTEIEYLRRGDARSSLRTVEPTGLECARGTWYLHARCCDAGGMRTFRVDRVRKAILLDEQFESRREERSGVFDSSGNLPFATVAFEPGVALPIPEWPGAHVIPGGEGCTLVRVPYSGTEWIARHVASYLGRARALEPSEIRAAVHRAAARDARGCTPPHLTPMPTRE